MPSSTPVHGVCCDSTTSSHLCQYCCSRTWCNSRGSRPSLSVSRNKIVGIADQAIGGLGNFPTTMGCFIAMATVGSRASLRRKTNHQLQQSCCGARYRSVLWCAP